MKVIFGTPISGFISGLNAENGPLDLSDLQANSLEFSSSDETVFTVDGDPATGKFKINQVAAGTASIQVSGINSEGAAVSGSDSITLDPGTPPPPPPDTVLAALVVNYDPAPVAAV